MLQAAANRQDHMSKALDVEPPRSPPVFRVSVCRAEAVAGGEHKLPSIGRSLDRITMQTTRRRHGADTSASCRRTPW